MSNVSHSTISKDVFFSALAVRYIFLGKVRILRAALFTDISYIILPYFQIFRDLGFHEEPMSRSSTEGYSLGFVLTLCEVSECE